MHEHAQEEEEDFGSMRRRIFAKNEKTVSASDAARLKKEKARERERTALRV